MGKYDDIFNTKDTAKETLAPEESVAALAMVAAFADIESSDVQTEAFATILSRIEFFDSYDEDDLAEIIDKILGIFDQKGIGALYNTAMKYLSEDLPETAFAAAIAMIIVDGEIPDEKNEFVSKLQEALDISNQEAAEIIEDILENLEESMAEYEEA